MPTITRRPNANGTFQQFDTENPGGSLHWQDESDINDGTWILNSNIPYEIDTYLKAPLTLPPGATINSVTLWARGIGNVVFNVYLELLIGGVLYASVRLGFSTFTITNISYTWNKNPATGLAWTSAAIDAMEIGLRANASLDFGTQVMEVWLVVDYSIPIVPGGGLHEEIVFAFLSAWQQKRKRKQRTQVLKVT